MADQHFTLLWKTSGVELMIGFVIPIQTINRWKIRSLFFFNSQTSDITYPPC